MLVLIWLSLVLSLLLVVLLPLFFAELMAVSLAKLHLAPSTALLLVAAIIVGGLINIPVKRIPRSTALATHPFATFGILDWWPEMRRLRTETVIAVNLGGCVIPAALALYETLLVGREPSLLVTVAIASSINVVACYFLARPVSGIGIALPALVPALISAGTALLLAPDQAPPVAYVAGVAGPLIGADLLHLKDIRQAQSGILSIGGAGTFDGIVLSGVIAAYLA